MKDRCQVCTSQCNQKNIASRTVKAFKWNFVSQKLPEVVKHWRAFEEVVPLHT